MALTLCLLRDCPATCSKAVFAAEGLHLSPALEGCLVQAANQSSSGLYLRWSSAVVAVSQCRHTRSAASQPALGRDTSSREGVQAAPLPQRGTSPLLFLPRCPKHCSQQKLSLRVQRRHLQDTRVCWTGRSGTAAPGSQEVFLPQPSGSARFLQSAL